MAKKVPPYLRHTKPPYIIHAYSPVLAARTDMVPWYKAPVIERYEPILTAPEELETEAPLTAMNEADFRRHVAEQTRVEALKLKAKGDGALEAIREGKVNPVAYDLQEPFQFEAAPEDALTEDDFARIAEPDVPSEPQTPMAYVDDEPGIPHDAPVEGTPDGNAAKRHGQVTREQTPKDTFQGIKPPSPKVPFAGKAPKSPFAPRKAG